jgi:G:T/U-mismatch repair DNA glycosylase
MGDSRCGDPPFCERQLETLRARRKRVEEMERDRDAVLEHYAALAPEALDSLTSEEHHQLYKMHKLKVFAAKSGDLTIEFAGVPTESVGPNSSSTAEVISRFARTGARW